MKHAFTGADAEARYERAANFLLASVFGQQKARDWCDRKGVKIVKAAGEGINSAGGFLVPVELEKAILDLRDSYGAFRRRARVWPMGRDTGLFPRRLGTAVASFVGENAAAGSTSTNMDGVQLTAKKLAVTVTVSSELEEDAAVDLVDYVANELAWAFAAKEDDCAFNGDGTSTYGGIRGISTIALDGQHGIAKVQSTHSTFATLTGADLAAVVSAVRASALPRAAYFISVTGFGQAISNDATGGYLYNGEVDGIPTPFFNGFPIIVTQKLPLISTSLSGKVMLAFGDMYGAAVLGQRRGLTIARSDERYFDIDQIGIRGTERFDAVVHDMGDNANAGSLAVLVAQ